jgi:glycosyltransferase involved in cell wall biosynthesis
MTDQSNFNDRVWMIGWEYPPNNSGGLGVACQGLTGSLVGMNTHIYFTLPYAVKNSGAISHMEIVECVSPHTTNPYQLPFSSYSSAVPTQHDVRKTLASMDAVALAALPQSDLEYKVTQYAQMVSAHARDRAQDFEVIHAHDWMSFPAAVQVKQRTGKPLVAHIHSTEFDRIPSGGGSQYIHDTEWQGLQFADKVIAVSEYTKQILIEKYAIAAEKIEVIHNGVLPSPFPIKPNELDFAPGRPVVVFMGRLTGQKGPEYFLHLSQRVLKALPAAVFIVAGSGDLYHSLLMTTARERLSAAVLFSGFVRGEDQARLLDRADVFVMPSVSEPFGLVALEAAEHHTPVIVSKNSGVKEVLPSALALDFWDLDKMVAAIVDIVQHKEKKAKMIDAQLQEVAHLDWNTAAQKVKYLYRSLLHAA